MVYEAPGLLLCDDIWCSSHTHRYDTPIDEEQQKEIVRQIMSNFIDKKSEAKKSKVGLATPKPNPSSGTASSATASATSTKAPQKSAKPEQHKEDKIPKVSKLHGQKEYAMLRPAGAEARRPLPDLWPEDPEVQQLVSLSLIHS